ncbi:hypothetical protein FHW16_005204 [Phyllobacterium myrsinacearum]|uniref:Transposase n=1 Tax=Phyllobacterium myrsinacearum TaxID=28101 RepID=A0A839ELR1_9HYPH|nr:hypothetical protein [Phyllobacterium myrsinacearum]
MSISQPPVANYKNHRFPPEIIVRAVWLCYRFPLNLQQIEEMLLTYGIAVPMRPSAGGAENMIPVMPCVFGGNRPQPVRSSGQLT